MEVSHNIYQGSSPPPLSVEKVGWLHKLSNSGYVNTDKKIADAAIPKLHLFKVEL